MGVVEQELEQLKLAPGEGRFAALVTDLPALRVEPEPVQLPDPLVPKVHPGFVTLHLAFDDGQVIAGGLARGRAQLRNFTLDPTEQPPLELEEVGVDAHPVPGVLPVGGAQVLSLQWLGNRSGNRTSHAGSLFHHRKNDAKKG